MKPLAPILKNKASRMGEEQRRKKPLADRIKERLRDLVDDLVDSLEGLVVPQPEPVPVRPGPRRYNPSRR
jgi:hypothetical protein